MRLFVPALLCLLLSGVAGAADNVQPVKKSKPPSKSKTESEPTSDSKAGGSEDKESQPAGQVSWDAMMKLNRDVLELIKGWAPERLPGLKPILEEFEGVGKLLGELNPRKPEPFLPARLEDFTKRSQEMPQVLPPAPAGQGAAKPVEVARAEPARPDAGTVLRARSKLPPVLLPVPPAKNKAPNK